MADRPARRSDRRAGAARLSLNSGERGAVVVPAPYRPAMDTKYKDDDVPPLGFCADCIREGSWTTALTTYKGTSTCAHHLIYNAGTGELEWPENLTDGQKSIQILDRLARHNPTSSSHF